MSFNEGCRLLSVDQLVRVVLPSASPDVLLTEEIDDCLFALHRQLTCASDHEAKLTVHLRRRKPQRGVRIEIRNGEKEWLQLGAEARLAIVRALLARVLGVLLDALACFRPEHFANPGEEAIVRLLDAAQVALHVSLYVERRCRKEDDPEGSLRGPAAPPAKRAKKSPAPTAEAPAPAPAPPTEPAPAVEADCPAACSPPPPPVDAPETAAVPEPPQPPPRGDDNEEEEESDRQLRLVAWMLRNRSNLAAALYEARSLPRVTRQEAERLEDVVAGYPALERARQRAMGREPIYPAPVSRAQFEELRRVYVEALAVYATARPA